MHPKRSSLPLPLSRAEPEKPLEFSFEFANPLNIFQPFFKHGGAACLRGGGVSGGIAVAVVDLMLWVWFSLFCVDTCPCLRMLPALPAWIRLSTDATFTGGEQAGATLTLSARAGGASHVPTAHPQLELRGFRGPQHPHFGRILELRCWAQGCSLAMPTTGCMGTQCTLRCLSLEMQPMVSEICSEVGQG